MRKPAATAKTAAAVTPATVAAAPARKPSTTAKVTPAKAAPAATPAPAADVLAGLAAAVTAAPALPQISRKGGGKANPFTEQVKKSYDTKAPLQTGALPNADVAKTVENAIIRGANALGLGVKIRKETSADGSVVITFQAQDKAARKAAPKA